MSSSSELHRSPWKIRETALLASYATFSDGSDCREHPEEPHAYRGPFQRDRDRIVHSAAFRRLSGKMQVFTGDMGDYHRTRLTHTQEVASIARTIGRQLRLNEDLIEALALLHDVGHPPYGHSGEDALNRCMSAHGGFSHNRFALQLVQQVETRYTELPGLNLTLAVLKGQEQRVDKQHTDRSPSLEVQVVNAADSIAYDAHDIDDAIQLGLLDLDRLSRIPFIQRCYQEQSSGSLHDRTSRQFLTHAMVESQVNHFLAHVQPLLLQFVGWSSEGLQRAAVRLSMQPGIEAERSELEKFLFDNVYRHTKLKKIREQAATRITQQYHLLVAYPARLPERFRHLSETLGVERSVGTYLAGMTDRFCDESYIHLVEMGREQAQDW